MDEEELIKLVNQGKITPSEFEKRLGITESRDDFGEGYCGDDNPPSDYYIDDEPDYELMHRAADTAIDWYNKNRKQ